MSKRYVGVALVVAAAAVLVVAQVMAEAKEPRSGLAQQAGARVAPLANVQVERELPALRTARSRTYRLSNGSRTTRLFTHRVHYRNDEGQFARIDNGLSRSGNRYVNGANDVRVSLPRASADGGVRVRSGGTWLEMRLESARATAEVDGDRATYRNVADGVDVVMRTVESGVKEDLVLSGPDSQRAFAYALRVAPGARVRAAGDGGLEVLDHAERVALRVPPAYMRDSASAPAVSSDVRYRLERAGRSEWRLRVVLDDEWLDDPARRWPVVVDPTVSKASPVRDCAISSEYSTSRRCGSAGYGALSIGSRHVCPGSTAVQSAGGSQSAASIPPPPGSRQCVWHRSRALMRFDLGAFLPARALINSATLGLTSNGGSSLSSPLYGHRVTRGWDAALTWTNATAATNWTTAGADYVASAATSIPTRPAAGGAMRMDVTTLVRDWQDSPSGNFGVLLRLGETNSSPTCYERNPSACPAAQSQWLFSSAASDPAQRPYLEVNWDPVLLPASKLVSPHEGALTARKIVLEGVTPDPSITGVRFQYVAPNEQVPPASRPWREVPLSALRGAEGEVLTSYPLPVTGGRTPAVTWDLQATPGMEKDGPVHVRAFYEGPGGGVSEHINFRLDRRDTDGADSAQIGPGSVNLLSGDFTMTSTDVSVDSHRLDLTLSRTYHTRGSNNRRADLFGPGWESSVEVADGAMPFRSIYNFVEYDEFDIPYDEEDPEAGYETVRWEYEYALIEDAGGGVTAFYREEDGAGGYIWIPEDEAIDLTLKRDTAGAFTVIDGDGSVTVFTPESAGSPLYRPTEYREPGSSTATTFEYQIVNGVRRIRRVRAPQPPGIDCAADAARHGCRSLVFDYTTVSTPSGPAERLSQVSLHALSPWQATATPIARYQYDANGRLSGYYDPRISPALVTRYEYDAQGRLSRVTPPGEHPWTLTYTTSPGDLSTGRLQAVTRPAIPSGSATNSVVYDVPVAGSGAPHEMAPPT